MPRLDFEDFLTPTADDQAASTSPGPLVGARLRGIETAVRRLPALPALLQEVMAELGSKEASVRWLEEKISGDPSLATRLLKMANSSFYNARDEVVSVSRALMTLGFKTVSNLMLASSMRAALSASSSIPGYKKNGLFRHSVGVAVCANRMSRLSAKLTPRAEELFVAGLLHDVGKVALGGHYEQHESAFNARGTGLDNEAERAVLGIDHLEVGRMVWEHWKLPQHLLCPIARHHDEPRELADEPTTLAVIVANEILDLRGFALTKPIGDEHRLASALHFLALERKAVEASFEDFESEIATFMGDAA